MEHSGGRGEKYQARRARCRWRAAPLCPLESVCRADVELGAANFVAGEHAGAPDSRRDSEHRSRAAGVRRHLDGSNTRRIAGIAPIFREFGGGIRGWGALAGLDRNLRFTGLYGWPKSTRDGNTNSPWSQAVRYPQTHFRERTVA